MRILMTSTEGGGHVGPLLPFAAAVTRAGGEVLIATSGAGAVMARAAGHHVHELGRAPKALRDPAFALARREPAGLPHPRVIAEVFAGLDADAALPGVLAACEQWRPDAIVHESCEFAAVIAAELTGLPRVRVAIGTAVTERAIVAAALEPVAARRAAAGLPEDPAAAWAWGAPSFAFGPRALEDPDVPGMPGTLRFRPPLAAGAPLPALWPGDERPLVQLTLGTVVPGTGLFPRVYREAADALGELPARVLVTVGRGAEPTAIGPLPRNVRAVRWLPQADVVAHAAAIACHGGSGTVHAALAGGVPLAILPLFADQPHNASRVAATGAGVTVAEPAALGPAVARLLGDPGYRRRAEAVARDFAATPEPDVAVPVLRELVELARRLQPSQLAA